MAGKNPITVLKEAEAGLSKVNSSLKVTIDNILAINDAALKIPKNIFNVKSPQQLNNALKKNKTVVSQLNVELQERQRLELALERQLARNKIAESENAKSLAKARYETQQLNRANKEAAILSSSLATAYQKQSTVLIQLRRKYKDVALTQGESSKAAKKLLTQITALDARLKRVDANVGQFQRSVGNYGKAMQSAVGAARNLAGALGFVGGAFLAVRVVGDAFRRIKEFDKEMQNMSGILRTSRKELASLEQRIIGVASVSIKTSNEVAKLATSLLVLGKTKSEVEDLIEPVNNLSIALGATSDETGEFLVQTLNAFGAGTESALQYADTIAAIRTSTSLNFQRMRDSFQYITPISKILNKDLAYTGAVVGVLADNGLKAESAGRLLATAQIKLATAGKTLQDGLNEVNKAYESGASSLEVLGIANDLFGKQAAKIGVILATQQDRLQEYDDKIRQASGSLDDLVNEQLKSVDAQLKITNSTWEEFILSVEKGDGAISGAFKNVLTFINGAIKGMTLLNQSQEEYNTSATDESREKTFKEQIQLYKDLGDSAKRVALDRADRARDEVDSIESQIKALKDKNIAIREGLNGNGKKVGNATDIGRNNIELEKLATRLGVYQGVLKASESIIVEETEVLKKNTEATVENEESKQKSIEGVKGSIIYYTQLIAKLEEKQSKLATTSKAWNNYQTAIEETKQALSDLKTDFQGLDFQGVDGDIESSFTRIKEILNEDKKLEGYDYDSAKTELDAFVDSFKDAEERKRDEVKETAELRKELESGLTSSSIDLVNTLFDAKVQRYEDDINRNNDYYANLLDNDKLSLEQRSALEAERDRKKSSLEKKKREEQRKAAIFNKAVALSEIVVNTAISISKVAAQTGVVSPLLIPGFIALGAIQAATVLAQPIPKYEKGKNLNDNYEGAAIWGEKRQELKISKDGTTELSPKKIANHLTHVKKDDIIIPDAQKYLSNLSDQELYDNVHRHAILSSVSGQSESINNLIVKNAIDNQTNKLIKAYKESRPKINLQNNNVNNVDFDFIKRGLDIL